MYLYTVISFDIPLIKYILEYGRNKVEDRGWGGGGYHNTERLQE